jgi:hypothetical protein
MLKVVDPNTQETQYFVMPNLNLSKPGHIEILRQVQADQTAAGKEASIVSNASGDRQAAIANHKVTEIKPDLVGDKNRRADFQTALAQLAAIIDKTKKDTANDLAISPQEAANVKKEMGTALSLLDKASATSQPADTASAAKAIETAINAKTTPGTTGTTPTASATTPTVPATVPANTTPGFQDAYDKQLGNPVKPVEAPEPITATPGEQVNVTPSTEISTAPDVASNDIEQPLLATPGANNTFNQTPEATSAPALPNTGIQEPKENNNITSDDLMNHMKPVSPNVPSTKPLTVQPNNPVAPISRRKFGATETS